MPSLRVLTVARWYPSHDVPFRGAFVADLVAALGGIGIDVVVASWEPALVRGARPTPAEVERVETAWAEVAGLPAACNTPASWGARVPVARLPEVDDGVRAPWQERVRAHAALVGPFADALAQRWPVDLVHAHTGIPDGLAAASIADRLGVPLVVTEHASDAASSIAADPALAGAYRSLLEGDRRLVAISDASAGRLATALGIARERIAVIGNVVDIAAFSPVGPAERDPDELLWVGERSDKKGTGVLLAAMARLAPDHPRLRLRMIGRSPTPEVEARWVALVRELGITDRVVSEGPAGRPAVAAALARAAVFVHPSPAETFGVVAAEAAASGLPVAATPSGGVEGIVGSDRSLGTIAAGHDPAELADAIEDVIARRGGFDPAVMRRSVEERFSGALVARRYERLYTELVTGRASRIGADIPVPAQPMDEAPPAPALVVGTQRVLLERRVAELPWRSHRAVTMLTLPAQGGAASAGSSSPASPLAGVSAIEVDPDGPFAREMARLAGPRLSGLPASLARPLRLLLRPRAALARRRLRGRRDELRRQELERLVLDAWRQRSAGGSSAWIVALDPVDVLAARAAVDAGARLAPGGLRWLADRLDAASGAAGR